ncbi:MAG: aminopeptidase P family protein [Deltaproteobacteria bacterium]|nr:aminopeptidase P family protein [Deltaproteobacteria bacterium]MBW1816666.1 aminopeptidase P family protein [Deltaproteobacteria bacterium]MBW2284655.1 aminopeptidase P family protein [Deltaproteobacteria bacterium]
MTYKAWVEKELGPLSRALGFRYTPEEEIHRRLETVRQGMKQAGMEGLLCIQKMDGYYLSGTAQEAVVFVHADGRTLLMVKRELERARLESPLEHVVGFESFKDLPGLIESHSGALPGSLGLELDMLPVNDFQRIQGLFPAMRWMDASRLIREARKIKSPFEVEMMKIAGDIARKVYLEGREILKEGMTEIRFGGLMEAAAKDHGHEGLLRVRSMNYEAYTWHVLSGPNGGIVSQSDSPMGGLGLSPAFPVGASLRQMKTREPILVDFGICYHGYQVDQTRMFSLGRMNQKFLDAFRACREIHDAVLDQTRPGADCETLFRNTVELAKKLGYEDSYLGPPGLQTRFVGHGIGLELNEPPFLAERQSYPLEEGMTFAVEPKIVFPGEGAVGIENTVLVTGNGCQILTPLEQDIFEV